MTRVKVLKKKSDGYENLYLLELVDSNSEVWAYGIEHID
ncbi:hypothetical protein RKD55_000480 [Rossellomorea marisflavi]